MVLYATGRIPGLSSPTSRQVGLNNCQIGPDRRPKVGKRSRAAEAKKTKPKVELTKAEAKKAAKSAENTNRLNDGKSMFSQPTFEHRQVERRCSSGSCPVESMSGTDKKECLVLLKENAQAKQWAGLTNQQLVFLLTNSQCCPSRR